MYLSRNIISFDESKLNKLKEFIEDKIPDIRIYTTVLYALGLNKLAQRHQPISIIHLEYLPDIYAYEDLRLGNEDFTQTVNNSILSILLNEANKQEFDEKIFKIIDNILFSGDNYRRDAIDILWSYTSKKFKIPDNTQV